MNQKPNYLLHLLSSNLSVMSGGLSVIAGAVLSFKFGMPGFLLPPLVWSCAAGFASAVIPGNATYRALADRQYARTFFEDNVKRLGRALSDNNRPDYRLSFGELIASARKLDELRKSAPDAVTPSDVESVFKACLNYGNIACAIRELEAWQNSIDLRAIRRQLEDIERDLERTPAGSQERLQLMRAHSDLESTLTRTSRNSARLKAYGATLSSLPSAIFEVYQIASMQSSGSGAGDRSASGVDDALSRLRQAETIESELGMDAESFSRYLDASMSPGAVGNDPAPRADETNRFATRKAQQAADRQDSGPR